MNCLIDGDLATLAAVPSNPGEVCWREESDGIRTSMSKNSDVPIPLWCWLLSLEAFEQLVRDHSEKQSAVVWSYSWWQHRWRLLDREAIEQLARDLSEKQCTMVSRYS